MSRIKEEYLNNIEFTEDLEDYDNFIYDVIKQREKLANERFIINRERSKERVRY